MRVVVGALIKKQVYPSAPVCTQSVPTYIQVRAFPLDMEVSKSGLLSLIWRLRSPGLLSLAFLPYIYMYRNNSPQFDLGIPYRPGVCASPPYPTELFFDVLNSITNFFSLYQFITTGISSEYSLYQVYRHEQII